MEKVHTSDLYEASYYLVNGCEITSIETLPVNGRVTCTFTFEGNGIIEIQKDYFDLNANVNLYQFRKAYNQINSFLGTARAQLRKKKAEREDL